MAGGAGEISHAARDQQQEQEWSVEKALDSIIPSKKPEAGSTSPVPFFHMLERLKTTKREGWRRFDIDNGESISDHMYRMALMTMFAPTEKFPQFNLSHAVQMALVHDMAEALVGDITPVDGVDKAEKSRREAATIDYFCDKMLGNVGGGQRANEIRNTWREYEDSVTPESKFVHDIDKLELLLQMVEYEKEHECTVNLEEFEYVATKINSPDVKLWAEEVVQERRSFRIAMGKEPITVEGVDKAHQAKQDAYYAKEE